MIYLKKTITQKWPSSEKSIGIDLSMPNIKTIKGEIMKKIFILITLLSFNLMHKPVLADGHIKVL